MDVNEFSQQIQAWGLRLPTLLQPTAEPLRMQKELMKDSIELQTAWEELQVAVEELCQQNEQLQQQNQELIDARIAVESERQRYQELFEFSPDGYLLIDAQGMILEANHAASTLLNIKQKFLAGKLLSIFFSGEARHVFLSKLSQFSQVNWVQEWEASLIPRDSQPIHAVLTARVIYNSEGIPASLHVRMRDITATKQIEEQIRQLNAELSQRAVFEAMLKRITEKVRDSLDPSQILQAAVQELTLVLGVSCCNTALYDLETGTSTIYYEYATSNPGAQTRQIQIAAFPEIYQQLLQSEYCQFCSIAPNPIRGRVAMLACPIIDERGVLGDLWLVKQHDEFFNELELQLVIQVASQCAIALRQARLYQASLAQVKELEKLNALKDDFLSTVSHELRTPLSNMKMAICMLETSILTEQQKRYLTILQAECKREIELINDLLDLQRLETVFYPNLLLEAIDLPEMLPELIEPFRVRTRQHQQTLRLSLPNDIPKLIYERASLERILAELLNNACKYTLAGGEIVMSCCYKSAQAATIFTISNSIEIPGDQLPHIFEKFYRVPNADPWKQGGTGLGLALVQKLVKHLGGSICVESSRGWTTFTVELPAQACFDML